MLCAHIQVHVPVSLCACIHIWVHMHVYIFTCAYMCLCACVYMHVHVCVYIWNNMCIYFFLWLPVFIYMHVWVCIYLFMCMSECECVFVFVCLFLRSLDPEQIFMINTTIKPQTITSHGLLYYLIITHPSPLLTSPWLPLIYWSLFCLIGFVTNILLYRPSLACYQV